MSISEEVSGPELIEQYVATQFSSSHSRYVRGRFLSNFDEKFGLRSASRADVEEWLARPGIGEDTTYNGYLSGLRAFYRWAREEELMDRDPTAGMKFRATKKKPPVAISQADLDGALANADKRTRALLLLMAGAGCTQKEIAQLTPDDIRDREGTPMLRARGKGGRLRIVPIRGDVLRAFDEAYSVPGPEGWERREGRIGADINRYLRDECHLKLSAYALRHRYGYDTFAETQDLVATQRRLGLATPGAAEGYMPQAEVPTEEPDDELSIRIELWALLRASGDPLLALAELVDMGIAHEVGGVFKGRDTRAGTADATGAAISVTVEVDALASDDVLYSFTDPRGATDQEALRALEAAQDQALPVFVISEATRVDDQLRAVRLGWVVGVNEEARLALVSLGELPLADSDESDTDVANDLIVSRAERQVMQTVRSGQRRFKFWVLDRYGPQCAVCDLAFPELLEAAHICPWAEYGTDDPSNGLVLCPLHHRAFDEGYLAIRPETLELLARSDGPSLSDLRATRDSLQHLRNYPSEEALRYAWDRRWLRGRRTQDFSSE